MTDPRALLDASERKPVPPFAPDPDIVHQVEGDRRAVERYRRAAEKARSAAADTSEGTANG